MRTFSAINNGLPQAPIFVEESAIGILSHIDGATRETKGGNELRPWEHQPLGQRLGQRLGRADLVEMVRVCVIS